MQTFLRSFEDISRNTICIYLIYMYTYIFMCIYTYIHTYSLSFISSFNSYKIKFPDIGVVNSKKVNRKIEYYPCTAETTRIQDKGSETARSLLSFQLNLPHPSQQDKVQWVKHKLPSEKWLTDFCFTNDTFANKMPHTLFPSSL